MVIDVITYNGEKELFEIRYNILKDYVDFFYVIEFSETFSGKNKPFYFREDFKKSFENKDFMTKVIYINIPTSEYWNEKYLEMADNSPNVPKGGAEHWKREFCQKESIQLALKLFPPKINDDDIVFIGDCDEIWKPYKNIPEKYWIPVGEEPIKLKLEVYTYYLNNHSTEEFWGTLLARYIDIKDSCLNHLRTNARKTKDVMGWHFTSMADKLRDKLTDSYTEESYATSGVLNQLEDNIKNNRDFLGRDFTYTLDEKDWPPWLKEHRQDYQHMLK